MICVPFSTWFIQTMCLPWTQFVYTMYPTWTHNLSIPCIHFEHTCSSVPCVHIQTSFIEFRLLSGTQGLFKTFVLPELTNYPCVYTRTRNLSWHVNTFNIQCHAHQVCYLNTHFIHIMCSTWTHSLTILCDHIVRICHMFKLNTQVIPIVQVTLST